ncbi:MAG TPA: hypothetical protein VF939_20400 [Puia sp.]
MKYLRLLLLLLAIACGSRRAGNKQDNSGSTKSSADSSGTHVACDVLTFKALKERILGRNISELPEFKCYLSKDTVLEGDEGVTWKGKAYYAERQLIFLAETNWENKQKIHRITVVSPFIKEGELFVGQELKKIRPIVADRIPSSPDGYLFLSLKGDSSISIQMDIAREISNKKLFYGVSDINKIPLTLKVESIVIM